MNERALRDILLEETRVVASEPPVAYLNRRMRRRDGLALMRHTTTVAAVLIVVAFAAAALTADEKPVAGETSGSAESSTLFTPTTSLPTGDTGRAADDGQPGTPAAPVDSEREPTTAPAQAADTTQPLELTVDAPVAGATLVDLLVTIQGTVTPGAEVHVNGVPATTVGGTWLLTVPLPEGSTPVTVVATLNGSTDEVSLVLTRSSPPDTTLDTDAGSDRLETVAPAIESGGAVPWSARQRFGANNDFPPWDSFRGTAPPNTVIEVSSLYGDGSTTANAEGEWWIRVIFDSDTPFDEPFDVVVRSESGTAEFSFVRPD